MYANRSLKYLNDELAEIINSEAKEPRDVVLYGFGRIGRFSNPPPQLGQTCCNNSTQASQNVHSNVQIMASIESFGKDVLQFSQVGLTSNT